MAHPLPTLIKGQLVKDIGVALVLGSIAGCYFKFGYVNRTIRERETFYAEYDKNN